MVVISVYRIDISHRYYNEYLKYLLYMLYYVLYILHMKFLVKLDFALILISICDRT